MDRIKQLLFGAMESIEIHSVSHQNGDLVREGIVTSMNLVGKTVPVSVKPACLNIEFIMVRYGRGIFRAAHADVMVLN